MRRSCALGWIVLAVVGPREVAAQTCAQFVDIITAPSGAIGNHACDSDHDGTIKDSNYCYCDDCGIQPERCHQRGDIAFCSCDPARQFCRPRPCLANGQCASSDVTSYYWDLDCNDYNRNRFPGNCEVCGDTVDDNCNGSTTDCSSADADGDGFAPPQDCNDNNPAAHPGAPEIQCNAIDEDCSGADLCDGTGDDLDHDGHAAPSDCNDNDAAVYPGAPDPCGDGKNSDCDSMNRDCPEDGDGDGTLATDDCDDSNPAVHPGAFDLCGDGADQDCSGADRACLLDQDRDGYDAFTQPGGNDCDDLNSAIHPTALETCGDGIDQDCSAGDVDCSQFDRDSDGHPALEFGGDDCEDDDDSVFPGAPEMCGDGIDSNCDGAPDVACGGNVGMDMDGDGFQGTKFGGEDCSDRDSRINPAATEICGDRVDNDCDGVADELCVPVASAPDEALAFVNDTGKSCACTAVERGSGWWPFVLVLLLLRRRR